MRLSKQSSSIDLSPQLTVLGAQTFSGQDRRKGNYEPKINRKYNHNAEGIEDKTLSLYAFGMSQWDIAEQIMFADRRMG